jgi:glycerol-3-phosphate acyltransferase PlsX
MNQTQQIRIGLDVMGGDYAPKAVIEGLVALKQENPNLTFEGQKIELFLIGKKDIIKALLQEYHQDLTHFTIIDAEQEISMEDSPVKALVEKKKSSIVIGLMLLAEKKIDAFASAGNTGAMLAGGFKIIGNIQGVIRPSLVSVFPKTDGEKNIILDVGANTDCRSDVLGQFARLGTIYAREVFKIQNPKVVLLNIGEEESKGTPLIRETYKMLKEDQNIHFIGNIEGRDLYNGPQDVTICDGFVGNIALKQTEAFYTILQEKKMDHLDPYFERFNFENYGGTVILGLKAPVIIGHGISNAKAIKNMILFSAQVVHARLSEVLEKSFLNDLPVNKTK